MKKLIYFVTIIALAGSGTAGLSSNSAASAKIQHAATGEIPASVREAVGESLPKAKSITEQHKDLTAAQTAAIEKESGLKLGDKDHHAYLLFAEEGGARKQLGVATVVKPQGREIVIVYTLEKGEPMISHADGDTSGVPHAFLDQFNGKDHDDKLSLGQEIKAQGVDEALARAIIDAIRLDVVTMQVLYGGAHTH